MHRESDLTQTEMPSMVAKCDKYNKSNFNESYTGNLPDSDSIINGYLYNLFIDRAFESLFLKKYS